MPLPQRGSPVAGRSLRGRLHSAETKHRVLPSHPHLTSAERIVFKHWGQSLPQKTSTEAVARAFVNHGRWSVRCPWCTSSQNASKLDHRFFCVECGSAPVKGAWVYVEWPENWREIEEVLLQRPDAKTRNWRPDESIEDLREENNEHALELLGGR